ncbi:MAG: aspartate-semialdehyde dehydrogenase [Candidatus Omnitrophica bacterium]|nr:aspartate-semialdehyde dehydrogenase [Candidatus Omnitrophota bacterium]MDD5429404.1 aspartate-semialdehyde dehydrogenase [Candidatus Omnitrophota bacterium]
MKKNLAVIGVGAVGVEILRILKQRKFPVGSLRVFARSQRDIEIDGQKYKVEAVDKEGFDGIDIALFAGTEGEKGASVLYANKFIEKGAVVIDNGNDFRLRKDVPLVIPEVNRQAALSHKGLIANPNCTTIQAVTALGGIHKKFGLKSFMLTSFQATSGAGKKAAESLWNETKALVEKNKNRGFDALDKILDEKPECFDEQIAFNIIPQIGGFTEEGYTSEEWKVVYESRKILDNPDIKISATCIRVPVFTSHSESIYFTPSKKVSLVELEQALNSSEGVVYLKDSLCFPLQVEGKDPVFVCRLRKALDSENSFWLWCVSDNLRKGAALNAVQIAQCLL